MLIAALTACGTSEAKKAEDTGGEKSKVNAETDATAAATKELEEATSFVIKGALDKDLEFTVDEIKGLAARDVETQLKDSGGNVTDITARGPTLKDVLKTKGIALEDFSAVQVKARDGYAVKIPEEVVRSRDIILAYQINGKPLPESDTPVRIVVPGEFAMYWVKAVSSLELKKDSAKVAAVRMLFMDSSGLEPVDYSFDDEGDKALVLKELLDKFAIEYEGKPFLMKARDGLKKTEEMETAKKAYIKITGENAPEFISPDISYGSGPRVSFKQLPKKYNIKNLMEISLKK